MPSQWWQVLEESKLGEGGGGGRWGILRNGIRFCDLPIDFILNSNIRENRFKNKMNVK